MRRILALMLASGALAAATVSVGCSSNSSTRQPAGTSHSPVTSPTSTAVAGLVGRWERVVTCQQLVSELGKAGLGPLAPYAWLGQTSSTGLSSFARPLMTTLSLPRSMLLVAPCLIQFFHSLRMGVLLSVMACSGLAPRT